jgi:hypothetical protein
LLAISIFAELAAIPVLTGALKWRDNGRIIPVGEHDQLGRWRGAPGNGFLEARVTSQQRTADMEVGSSEAVPDRSFE